MKITEHQVAVYKAHLEYAEALNAVDIASAELATAKTWLESAHSRVRQLARIEVDE